MENFKIITNQLNTFIRHSTTLLFTLYIYHMQHIYPQIKIKCKITRYIYCLVHIFSCGSFKTFAVFRMQSVFFWEFPRRLKFKSRRFGTQCRFHRPGRSPRTMEPTLSSETLAFKLQTPGKFPKEHRLHIFSCL